MAVRNINAQLQHPSKSCKFFPNVTVNTMLGGY